MHKQQTPAWLLDVIDPGWREREREQYARFFSNIPVRCNCMFGACQQLSDGCRDRAKKEPASKPA